MLLALLLSLPSALALDAVITAAPLLARQEVADDENPRLIGYTYNNGEYALWDCRESSAFLTSGNFGRCAETAVESFIATGCLSDSIMAGDGTSSTCTGSNAQTLCQTGTVYRHIGDEEPIMNYQCWPEWDQGDWEATITTSVPVSTSSSTATPSPSSTFISRTSSAASKTPSESASGTASETASPQESSGAPEPEDDGGSESKAWIAGAVIGALGGLALIGAAFWFYRRRQRNNAYKKGAVELGTDVKPAPAYGYGHPNQPGQPGNYSEVYAHNGDGKQLPPAELPGQAVAELDGSLTHTKVVEADGTDAPKAAGGVGKN